MRASLRTCSTPPAELIELGNDDSHRWAVPVALLVKLGLDHGLRIENEYDRPRDPIGAAAGRILWIPQLVAINDLGLGIRKQRVRQMTFDSERLQDFLSYESPARR